MKPKLKTILAWYLELQTLMDIVQDELYYSINEKVIIQL